MFYSLGACTIKLFMAVIFAISYKAKVFANFSHFHPRLVFAGKTGAYQCGAPYKTQLLLDLP